MTRYRYIVFSIRIFDPCKAFIVSYWRCLVPDQIKGTVRRIIKNGRNGPYLVATSQDIAGSITVSLQRHIWRERRRPDVGVHLHLSDLQSTEAGWRAMSARFWRPSDEEQPSKEQ